MGSLPPEDPLRAFLSTGDPSLTKQYNVGLMAAAMGAGSGLGGSALRNRLRNLYDLYAPMTITDPDVTPPGGFINWYSQNVGGFR